MAKAKKSINEYKTKIKVSSSAEKEHICDQLDRIEQLLEDLYDYASDTNQMVTEQSLHQCCEEKEKEEGCDCCGCGCGCEDEEEYDVVDEIESLKMLVNRLMKENDDLQLQLVNLRSRITTLEYTKPYYPYISPFTQPYYDNTVWCNTGAQSVPAVLENGFTIGKPENLTEPKITVSCKEQLTAVSNNNTLSDTKKVKDKNSSKKLK